MNKLFNKFIPVTAGALLAVSPLLADMDARLGKLEAQMRDAGTQNARGTFGANTASANPHLDGYGWFLSADALVWRLYDSSDAVGLAVSNPAVNMDAVQGSMRHAEFDWAWGFRTAIGYFAEHDKWDTNFGFTWYQTDASRGISASGPSVAATEYGNPETVLNAGTYTHSSTKWKVHYYDLVWELGRNFFVSKYLAVRPHAGIRTSWFYEHRNVGLSTATQVDKFNIYDRNNYWGIGPRVGLDGTWWFGRHFNMFSSLSAALLWGRFKVLSTSQEFGQTTLADDVRGGKSGMVPNMQFAIGLGYDSNFLDDTFNFALRISYDALCYWGENQMLTWASNGVGSNSSSHHVNADKTMQGFSAKFVFSF